MSPLSSLSHLSHMLFLRMLAGKEKRNNQAQLVAKFMYHCAGMIVTIVPICRNKKNDVPMCWGWICPQCTFVKEEKKHVPMWWQAKFLCTNVTLLSCTNVMRNWFFPKCTFVLAHQLRGRRKGWSKTKSFAFHLSLFSEAQKSVLPFSTTLFSPNVLL